MPVSVVPVEGKIRSTVVITVSHPHFVVCLDPTQYLFTNGAIHLE